MHRRVQGDVEGGDGADDAQRLADGHGHLALGAGNGFDADHFAAQIAGFDGRHQQGLESAFRLAARFFDGLPGLVGDYAREVFEFGGHQGVEEEEHVAALGVGHRAHALAPSTAQAVARSILSASPSKIWATGMASNGRKMVECLAVSANSPPRKRG